MIDTDLDINLELDIVIYTDLANELGCRQGRTLPIMSADVRYSGVYRCVADNSIKPPAESLTQVGGGKHTVAMVTAWCRLFLF